MNRTHSDSSLRRMLYHAESLKEVLADGAVAGVRSYRAWWMSVLWAFACGTGVIVVLTLADDLGPSPIVLYLVVTYLTMAIRMTLGGFTAKMGEPVLLAIPLSWRQQVSSTVAAVSYRWGASTLLGGLLGGTLSFAMLTISPEPGEMPGEALHVSLMLGSMALLLLGILLYVARCSLTRGSFAVLPIILPPALTYLFRESPIASTAGCGVLLALLAFRPLVPPMPNLFRGRFRGRLQRRGRPAVQRLTLDTLEFTMKSMLMCGGLVLMALMGFLVAHETRLPSVNTHETGEAGLASSLKFLLGPPGQVMTLVNWVTISTVLLLQGCSALTLGEGPEPLRGGGAISEAWQRVPVRHDHLKRARALAFLGIGVSWTGFTLLVALAVPAFTSGEVHLDVASRLGPILLVTAFGAALANGSPERENNNLTLAGGLSIASAVSLGCGWAFGSALLVVFGLAGYSWSWALSLRLRPRYS